MAISKSEVKQAQRIEQEFRSGGVHMAIFFLHAPLKVREVSMAQPVEHNWHKPPEHYMGDVSLYFASLSLHKNFHGSRSILSRRKICVVGGCGMGVNLVLALVQNYHLGFEFGLGPS